MEIHDHRLNSARQINSPNHSSRPEDEELSLLVIHNISLPPGEYGGSYIDDFFCNNLDCSIHNFFTEIKDLKVSSHLLIRRTGEITQYVPFNRKAWHAGQSNFQGREECNEFSIGIELEGCDTEDFTQEQYEQLGRVTKSIMSQYPSINQERIVGHSDIAPERKTDPGPHFSWQKYHQALFE